MMLMPCPIWLDDPPNNIVYFFSIFFFVTSTADKNHVTNSVSRRRTNDIITSLSDFARAAEAREDVLCGHWNAVRLAFASQRASLWEPEQRRGGRPLSLLLLFLFSCRHIHTVLSRLQSLSVPASPSTFWLPPDLTFNCKRPNRGRLNGSLT